MSKKKMVIARRLVRKEHVKIVNDFMGQVNKWPFTERIAMAWMILLGGIALRLRIQSLWHRLKN